MKSKESLLSDFPATKTLSSAGVPWVSSKKNFKSILDNSYNFQSAKRESYKNSHYSKNDKLAKEEFARKITSKAIECIDPVLRGDDELKYSFCDMHRFVESSCKLGNFLQLYNTLKDKIEANFEILFSSISEDMKSHPSKIEVFNQYWDTWGNKLRRLRAVFLYMENNYLIHSTSKKSIIDLGYEVFGDKLVKANSSIKRVDCRLYQEGESKMRCMIFADFVDAVGDYLSVPFPRVDETSESYTKITKFVKIVKKLDNEGSVRFSALALDLVRHISRILLKSNNIITDDVVNLDYLRTSYQQKEVLRNIFETPNLGYQMDQMVFWDRLDEITRILMPKLLLEMSDDIKKLDWYYSSKAQEDKEIADLLVKRYSEFWQNEIKKRFLDESAGDNFVPELLALYQWAIDVQKKFSSISELYDTAKEAFKKVFNEPKNMRILSDALNRYLDQILKRKENEKTAAISPQLREIFGYIGDKNQFLETYTLNLGRRLIFRKSAISREQATLNEVAGVCGKDRIKDLYRMCDDVYRSPDLANAFTFPFQVEFLILREDNWKAVTQKQSLSLVTADDFELHGALREVFDKSYGYWKCSQNTREMKKLIWYHNLSQLTLTSSYQGNEKTIFVNLLQGCILLLFNDHDELNIDDMAMHLKIKDDSLLITHLDSLSKGKYKLLLETRSGLYRLNESFKTKASTIKPSVPQATKSAAMNAGGAAQAAALAAARRRKTQGTMEESDKIRAQIVRLMKHDRELSHDQLLHKMALAQQSTTRLRLIKQNIEQLIDLEYIRRKTPTMYEYIP